MKQLISCLLLLVSSLCFGQYPEFGKTDNGLIYSSATIKELKFIVDSLNLKFKVCELARTYLSQSQAKAHYISLKEEKVQEAKKDMEENLPFDTFIKKYDKARIENELLIVKFRYKGYENKDAVEISSVSLNRGYGESFTFTEKLSDYEKPLKGKWIFAYYPKSNYSKESIEGFYFIENFSQQPLPDLYAKMVQYSDCMVDTSTQIFYDNAKRTGVRYKKDQASEVAAFIDYIHSSTNRPEYAAKKYNEKNYEKYLEKFHLWDSLRLTTIDNLKAKDPEFMNMLTDAVNDALENGGTSDEFEEYVARYYSAKTALDFKRNRRVIGGCSQDNSPRVHAMNIAKLSAETVNWEIFLRSHLDIMNDKFERVTDGSYAWAARKTYIKELEVLDINVLDLLLGITLRIENPSKNHYFGYTGRLGRALSETKQAPEIESKMLQIISDNKLDDYNRILIYYLFINYYYHLESKDRKEENKIKLIAAMGGILTN